MLDICACLQQRQVSEPTRPDDVLLESLLNSGQDEVFLSFPHLILNGAPTKGYVPSKRNGISYAPSTSIASCPARQQNTPCMDYP